MTARERDESVELLLFERTLDGGQLERCLLVERGAALAVGGAEARVVRRLPERAVDVVMHRYGRPLEDPIHLDGAPFQLESGAELGRFRYLSRFDVISRDYLLYRAPDSEPLAALAAPVSAALRHLALR